MGRVLRQAGHSVLDAGGAAQAIAACRAHAPDVLVLQQELCRRDDLSVVHAVKADADVYGTAVLLIVAPEVEADIVAEELRRGIIDVLVEPVREPELLARVTAAARTKSLQEELVEQTRRLERHLYEDALTRVYNRRFILTQLAAHMSAARRHGRPLALAVVDVDGFKALNDTYGHAAGDQVLVAVARALREGTRAEDAVGRVGGEEFLVLLPDTDAKAAAQAAERMRAAVAAVEGPEPVSASVGWATAGAEESPEDAVKRADEALYEAKAAGRNRVRAAARAPASLARLT